MEALSSRITINAEDIAELVSAKADTSYVNNSISSLDTELDALTTRVTTNEGSIGKYGTWIDNLVTSVANGLTSDSFDNFYKYLFSMIYPIGSIYTTVKDTDPPNIYDLSGNKFAEWKELATGIFLRNTHNSGELGNTGGTAVTELPEHTHTTNVQINGTIYSASRGETLPPSYDTKLINCGLFAPQVATGNVFYSETVITPDPETVAINWSPDTGTGPKVKSRATSSSEETNAYFPITLKVDEDYTSYFTTAANKTVELITSDSLPDNCPPYMYVKMYQRVK